jgi:hypothetical protein
MTEAPFNSAGLFTQDDIAYLQRICIAGRQKITAISRHLQS